jgi:hypothetical protein
MQRVNTRHHKVNKVKHLDVFWVTVLSTENQTPE